MGENQPAHARIDDPQKCNEKSPPGEECQPIECAPTSPTVPSPWPDRPALRGATARGSPVRRSPQGRPGQAHHEERIIPARAGCTWRLSVVYFSRKDHPRSRGVHSRAWPALTWSVRSEPGSSPLARGAPGADGWWAAVPGIIPARAGCTVWAPRATEEDADHPRSRGVHSGAVSLLQGGEGSSPLARGARRWLRRLTPTVRIIPARAGCTMWSAISQRAFSDHPRSRGVHRRLHLPFRHPRGSSPLARGAHGDPWATTEPAWIIPARAGCTLADQRHYRVRRLRSFSPDLVRAPWNCESAAVAQRSTTPPSPASRRRAPRRIPQSPCRACASPRTPRHPLVPRRALSRKQQTAAPTASSTRAGHVPRRCKPVRAPTPDLSHARRGGRRTPPERPQGATA